MADNEFCQSLFNLTTNMAKNIDLSRMIWEGWTAKDFVEELQPILDMIMNKQSCVQPFTTKAQLKEACRDMQPYYNKNIPEVVSYFAQRYGLK